jgi:hypothetical protein
MSTHCRTARRLVRLCWRKKASTFVEEVQKLRTGIRPSHSGRDALLAIQIDALQAEARSDEEIIAILLDLADMIRTLKIVLDAKAEVLRSE